jgi:hypothetical protein
MEEFSADFAQNIVFRKSKLRFIDHFGCVGSEKMMEWFRKNPQSFFFFFLAKTPLPDSRHRSFSSSLLTVCPTRGHPPSGAQTISDLYLIKHK